MATPAHALVVLGLCLLVAVACQAQLISDTLGSHMVLQRAPLVSRIWGFSAPKELMRIGFAGKMYTARSGYDGKWVLALPPTPAGGPYTIVVASPYHKVVLDDVYFGDVWLCGGQNNMQFTVNMAFNASQEIALANNYPHIRLFTWVGQGAISTQPQPPPKPTTQPWSVANATSINGQPWTHFSAVCWFYGKELYDRYKVPIGLVSSNWGGTTVQAWSSPHTLEKCKAFEEPAKELAIGVDPNKPSVLWNTMIVPFLDMSFKGVTWYQGESNVEQAKYYGCAFPAMINDWRAQFARNGGDLAFLFVQLAPWIGSATTAIPDTRAAQEQALRLVDVGMATAIDLGDAASPEGTLPLFFPFPPVHLSSRRERSNLFDAHMSRHTGNIHPRNKQEVGRRLSLVARHIAYGDKNVEYLNPRALNASLVEDMASLVRVHFDPRTIASGLVMRANSCPLSPNDSNRCAGFQILFNNNEWYNAEATIIDASTVEVFAPPPSGAFYAIGVRYAWADWPVCTLYSRDGLPALQFQFNFKFF